MGFLDGLESVVDAGLDRFTGAVAKGWERLADGPKQEGHREARDERRAARRAQGLAEATESTGVARAQVAAALTEEPTAEVPVQPAQPSTPSEPDWAAPLVNARSKKKIQAFLYWLTQHANGGASKAVRVDGKEYTFEKVAESAGKKGKKVPAIVVRDEQGKKHEFPVSQHTISYRPYERSPGQEDAPGEAHAATREAASLALRRGKRAKIDRRPATRTRVYADDSARVKADFLGRMTYANEIWFQRADGEWEKGKFCRFGEQKAQISTNEGYMTVPFEGAAFARKMPEEVAQEPGVIHGLMPNDRIRSMLESSRFSLRGKEIEIRAKGSTTWERGRCRSCWENGRTWEIEFMNEREIKLSDYDLRIVQPAVSEESQEPTGDESKVRPAAIDATYEVEVPSHVISVDLPEAELRRRMHALGKGQRVEVRFRGISGGWIDDSETVIVHRTICHQPDPRDWEVRVRTQDGEAIYPLSENDIYLSPVPAVEPASAARPDERGHRPLEQEVHIQKAEAADVYGPEVTGRTSDTQSPQRRQPVEHEGGGARLGPDAPSEAADRFFSDLGNGQEVWFSEVPGKWSKMTYVRSLGSHVDLMDSSEGRKTRVLINGTTFSATMPPETQKEGDVIHWMMPKNEIVRRLEALKGCGVEISNDGQKWHRCWLESFACGRGVRLEVSGVMPHIVGRNLSKYDIRPAQGEKPHVSQELMVQYDAAEEGDVVRIELTNGRSLEGVLSSKYKTGETFWMKVEGSGEAVLHNIQIITPIEETYSAELKEGSSPAEEERFFRNLPAGTEIRFSSKYMTGESVPWKTGTFNGLFKHDDGFVWILYSGCCPPRDPKGFVFEKAGMQVKVPADSSDNQKPTLS